MAEIHFSVSSDYKEVIRLRQEIEKLETQLKKMDVNKSPDIAKSIEKQLEEATRKIREYQEKYAKLKKIQDDIGKSNNTTDDVKKSTAALRSTNKWIEANTKAIIEADNQIKIFKKDFDSLSADDKVGSYGTAKLRQIEQVVAKRMAEAESIRKNIKAQKDKIIQDRSEEGSITQLRKQLSLLIVDYDNMGRLRREGGAGKALLAQIKVVQDELSKAEQASGRFQRNVGNYSSAFNGLGMSIQQIARELPTLSMGANMFFLAISNNLPIFFDEVQRARKEYTAYIAELKKGNTDVQKVAPVWKQIASGIFSWNTALTVGVTLLTVYGKDIVEWVKELINGKEAVDAFKEAQKQLNEAQSEGIKNAESEIIKLKLLRSLAEDESKHRSERLKAVTELQRLYPDYLGNIDKEKILTGQVSGLYESLSTNIEKAAIARAKFDKAVAVAKEKDALQEEFTAQVSSSSKIWTRLGINDIEQVTSKLKELKEIQGTTRGRYFGATQRAADIKALQAISDAYDALINKEKELKNITENIDVSGLIFNPNSNDAGKAIQIQQKIADELLKLQATNQQREIDLMKEGTEKKIAQINLDYKEQIEAIKKQADAWAKEQQGTLSAQQTMQVTKALENEEKIRQQKIAKVYNESLEAEAQAMRDYLKEYGTFQEQKLAIAQEYAKKIKDAQSEGERLTLARERDAAIQAKEIELIKQNIDWGSVFGSFGSIFKEQLQPTIDNLRKISNSNEFKNASLEEQKALYELISKLEQANTTWDSDIFKNVSRDLEDYQEALSGYIKAQEQEKNATENLALAKEKLARIEREGGITANAQNEVNEAQAKLNKASESVKIFGSKVQETTSDLQASAERTKNMFETLESGISGLTSGSLKGIGGGVMTLDKLFGGNITKDASNAIAKGFQSLLGEDSKASKALTEALGSAGMAGQVISAILGILDAIAENGISGIVTSLQDTILGAIEGILDDVFSGDIIVKPIKNSFKHIGNILDTVTFGGFSSWTSSSNAKEVARTTERLMDSNERLRSSVDRLVDEMENTKGGWKTIQTAEIAMKNQETINKQTMDILKTQMGYHGSHHSNTYYWDLYTQDYLSINKTLSDYAKINGEKAASVWNLEDIYKLTPEQMNAIRTYNSDVWSKMLDQGKYDKSKYWEQYADLAGALGEIKDSLNEIATQTTFDSLRDSFLDSLMDMDKSAKDFSDDFSKYMMQSILNAKISDLLDKDIQDFYNKWSEYSQTGNKMESWEISDLRDLWGDITDKGIKLRDEIASFTGYDNTSSSSQESSKKGFATASQDQIEELNGRFTAGQIAWEETKNQSVMQNEKLSILDLKVESLLNVSSEQRNIADETRTILANSYLELQQISENTGLIIKPITEMRDKMNSWDSKIRNM